MEISIAGRSAPFRLWKKKTGRVFTPAFAFAPGTTPVDPGRRWVTPCFVLGAAWDGRRGYFVRPKDLADFLAANDGVRVACHDAAAALAVFQDAAPDLDVYRVVDEDLVWDTRLLHRLLALATEGHTASVEGEATLQACARAYLNARMTGDAVAPRDDLSRPPADRLVRPLEAFEPAYLGRLAGDAAVTYRLYRRLRKLIKECLDAASGAWGHVSADWLAGQVRRWGPLTHHVQLKASIVLKAVTAAGLPIDLRRQARLVARLETDAARAITVLHDHGYVPGQTRHCKAQLQAILGRLRAHPAFPRSASGAYATTAKDLAPFAAAEPFVAAYLTHAAATTLLTFVGKMGQAVLHPEFDVLKTTGRTSSSGALNAQNLPGDDRVRGLIVPPSGHVWIDADYAAVEMATLAQALSGQFGLDSRLAVALNAGKDPHRMVAALATGKDEAEVTREERQRAKPINFGKPGTMGHDALKSYALASYAVAMTDDETEAFSDAWLTLFPEMRDFLGSDGDTGAVVAAHFGLTTASYARWTGSDRLTRYADPAGHGLPSPALGWMCLKVLIEPAPATAKGRPYDIDELDYFWERIAARSGGLPRKHVEAIEERAPSTGLRRAVMALVGSAPVFTLTGRLRAKATFSARHNTVFQGLAADGAKLALWRLWRAGYSVRNFVHDEVLVAVPGGRDLGRHARRIRTIMVAAMREVVPDVRIDVGYVASTEWSKSAAKVFDAEGRLAAWSPPCREGAGRQPRRRRGLGAGPVGQ